MGLLGDDDTQIAIAQGLLSGRGSAGLAAALGNVQGLQDQRLKRQLLQAQITDVMQQGELRKAQAAKEAEAQRRQQEGAAMLQNLMTPAQPQYQPGQLGSGTMGIVDNPQPFAAPVQRQGGLAGATPDQIAALENLYGYKLGDMYKMAQNGVELKPGTFRQDPSTGRREYIADPTKGVTLDQRGGIALMPGAENLATLAGQTAKAQEEAKAGFNLLPLDYIDAGTGRPIGGSVGGYLAPKKPQLTAQEQAIIQADIQRTGNPNPTISPQWINSGRPELQSKVEGERSKAMALQPIEAGNKINETWLKTSYEPVLTAGSAAGDMLTNVNTARTAMRNMGGTGWGTETKAAAAGVLSSLGVAGDKVEAYASNAQLFQNAAMSNLQTVLNAAKGPQTEGDAQRAAQTFAQLKNTPQANEYILDLQQARAERDAMRARFYQQALPVARQKGDLQEVDREWEQRMPSIFNMPTMRKWGMR